MFSFFKKKPPASEPISESPGEATIDPGPATIPGPDRGPDTIPVPYKDTAPSALDPAAAAPKRSWLGRLRDEFLPGLAQPDLDAFRPGLTDDDGGQGVATIPVNEWADTGPASPPAPVIPPAPEIQEAEVAPALEPGARRGWLDKLRKGLKRTGSSIAQVFTGTQIDDALYEELESALLMADAGVKATEFLLDDLKQRVKDARASDPTQVKALLVESVTDLLRPLEKALQVGEFTPTVFMVVGVNGAGKTTSIGKLTAHLALARQKVLLAAADTFRAAAREQLEIWADRNQVEIISQQGGDPAAVSFDAVTAGKARGCDVVIADTAGRLPTQLHLMEELKKIKRVIAKADATAPHEILLVVDGNTGQNALTQVKAFDDALGLTGLIVTKLDGTAKGGVLAAIARERPIPVYFVGVGEKLEDLETFDAREFAQALLT